MKVQELINKLEEAMKKNSDLKVTIFRCDTQGEFECDVHFVDVRENDILIS